MVKDSTTLRQETTSIGYKKQDERSSEKSSSKQGKRYFTLSSKTDYDVSLLSEIKVHGRYDVLKRVAWRLWSSNSFFVMYNMLIVSNIVVLVWEFTLGTNRWVVIGLEMVVNVAYLLEIVIEIMTQGRAEYFANFWNCLDVLVCLVCLVLFGIFLDEDIPQNHIDIESSFDAVIIIFRYLLQFIRMSRFALKGKSNREKTKLLDVVFEDQER